MKFVILAALLAASPAFAQTAPTPYTVDLTQDEAQAVIGLLENAVKAGGLQAAKIATPIADKLIAAGKKAQATDKAADEAAKIKAAVDAAKSAPVAKPTPVPIPDGGVLFDGSPK